MISNQNSSDQPMVTSYPSEKFRWNDELFSTSTIEECEKHFEEHCENNIHHFAETKDKLSLLRSCIDLLNRLDNTTNNHFAGKVLIFLARVIPFFDQSGVNLRSEFNVKELPKSVLINLQRIGSIVTEKDKQLSQLMDHDIEEGETLSDEESNDSTPNEDNDRIYERFWKVQQFLNQPNLLFDKNSWFTFRTHIDALIHKMESTPTELDVWNLRSSYLTDPKTLILQFKDIYMRRCFLVQLLIVLQYLEIPVDSRPENCALDKVQLSWSSTIVKRAYGLLDGLANQESGRKFLGLIRHLLKREEMWNEWKNDKCKEPKKPEFNDDDDDEMINMRGTYHKRRKISDELKSAKPYNMHVIGSAEMSRLWNMKLSQKYGNRPDLMKYLNIPIEKQAENFKDPNYSFRVLRLLRKSPYFFIPTSAAIQSLDGYLRETTKNYDIPSQTSKVTNNSANSST